MNFQTILMFFKEKKTAESFEGFNSLGGIYGLPVVGTMQDINIRLKLKN